MEIDISYQTDNGSHISYKSTSSNKDEESILHHKCPVIKLVKEQMASVDDNFNNDLEALKRYRFLRYFVVLWCEGMLYAIALQTKRLIQELLKDF